MGELGHGPVDTHFSVLSDPETGNIAALYIDDVLVTGPSRSRIKGALYAKLI